MRKTYENQRRLAILRCYEGEMQGMIKGQLQIEKEEEKEEEEEITTERRHRVP